VSLGVIRISLGLLLFKLGLKILLFDLPLRYKGQVYARKLGFVPTSVKQTCPTPPETIDRWWRIGKIF
jgi:hypothetical protein